MPAPAAPCEAVLFDLGGVVVDWDPRRLYREMFDDAAAMERFLAEVCSMDWHGLNDAGRPMAENCAELAGRFPHFSAEIEAWRTRWDEMFGAAIAESADAIHRLDDAGTPVYALSNLPAEKKAHLLTRYPVMRRFRDIIVSGEEGVTKPDRAIYEIAARRIGHEPARTLFIDDRAENVAAARDFGFDAILFETGASVTAALAARGLLQEAS